MMGAAILAIVVATGEVHDPATAIMIGAAGESLGPDVAIRLLGANQPEEADPLRIERELGAGAVVTLVWRDASRLRARIRLHVAASGHTTTRDLVFSEADTRVERGRTLGLAAASMWPEIRAPAATGDAARAPGGPQAPDRAPVASTATPALAAVAPAGRAPAQPSPTETRANGATPVKLGTPRSAASSGGAATTVGPRFALGLAALGATGVAGDARGIGLRIETIFVLGASWSLRAALSGIVGPAPALMNGTDLSLTVAGGVEWWPLALRAGGVARFGIRGDAMVLRQQVSGAAIPGETESQGRFVPGFDLLAQAALRAGARIEVVAAAGGAVALGNTEIRTGSPPTVAATLPAFQLVAEVGLRVGF